MISALLCAPSSLSPYVPNTRPSDRGVLRGPGRSRPCPVRTRLRSRKVRPQEPIGLSRGLAASPAVRVCSAERDLLPLVTGACARPALRLRLIPALQFPQVCSFPPRSSTSSVWWCPLLSPANPYMCQGISSTSPCVPLGRSTRHVALQLSCSWLCGSLRGHMFPPKSPLPREGLSQERSSLKRKGRSLQTRPLRAAGVSPRGAAPAPCHWPVCFSIQTKSLVMAPARLSARFHPQGGRAPSGHGLGA